MVPELAGFHCGQLFPDPLVHTPGGTKKSSGRGFRLTDEDSVLLLIIQYAGYIHIPR